MVLYLYGSEMKDLSDRESLHIFCSWYVLGWMSSPGVRTLG